MNNFETTYQENYNKMFRFAQKIVVNEDAVKDILQEVFIYYYQKLDNGHEIHNPKSWLLRATINKCIDYTKRQKKLIKIDNINPIMVKEDLFEINQTKMIVNQALDKLKPKERALAILYSEGLPYLEISQLTDIKYSSVGKTISRTLKKLKIILKKLNYEMY